MGQYFFNRYSAMNNGYGSTRSGGSDRTKILIYTLTMQTIINIVSICRKLHECLHGDADAGRGRRGLCYLSCV